MAFLDDILNRLQQGAGTVRTAGGKAASGVKGLVNNVKANLANLYQQNVASPQGFLNPQSNLKPFVQPVRDVIDQTRQNAQAGDVPSRFVQSRYIEPAQRAVAPRSSLLDRFLGGLQTAGNVVAPAATPLFAGIDAVKGAVYNKRKGADPVSGAIKGFTGEDIKGVGDALTDDPTLAGAGNLLEFAGPLLHGGYKGIKNLKKNIDISHGKPPAPSDIQRGKFEVMILGNGKMKTHSTHDTAGQAKKSAEMLRGVLEPGESATIRDVTPEGYQPPKMGFVSDEQPKQLDDLFAQEKAPASQPLPFDEKPNVYHHEPDVKKFQQKQAELQAKKEFNEWQKTVYKQTAQEEGQQTRQAVDTISGAIGENTKSPFTRDVIGHKDISSVSKGFNNIYRNFKSVFKDKFPEVKRQFLDPFDQSKGQRIDMRNQLADELENVVVKKLGINMKSKESEAVQLLGEGKTTAEELAKQFGPQKAQNIIQANEWFRGKYDQLLDQVNATRARIYPNNPDKIIPKRQDYFRHFQEMASGLQGFINIFDNNFNIASDLSGLSDFTKPKSKWLSFAQKRKGDKTTIDAVQGFLNYIEPATYAIHIDPHIQNFRSLATELATATGPDTPQAGQLNNFIEMLHDYSNSLSGKTNPLDRGIQKYFPGGRKAMTAIQWINNRVKANVILGNFSSAVAQLGNIPAGIASAGPINSTKGLGRSLTSILMGNKEQVKSNFLKERYADSLTDRFDTSLLNSAKEFAKWITSVGDEIGTKYIWNSHYEKALGENIPNPVKYADDITRNIVGGRGVGERPIVLESKLVDFVAPFQLEVNNLWYVLKDFVDQKQFGKIATFLVAAYAFNQGAKAIRGSDVLFDPIQSSLDAMQAYQEEEDKRVGLVKAGGRLSGELLSNVMGGQTIAGLYPEYGYTLNKDQENEFKFPQRKELFGEGDPTRFGSGLFAASGLKDPAYKLAPPFGGGQIKKTLEGSKAVREGQVTRSDGDVLYEVDQSLPNQLRAIFFGKSGLPETQEYYNKSASLDSIFNPSDDTSTTRASVQNAPTDEVAKAGFFDNIFKSKPKVETNATRIKEQKLDDKETREKLLNSNDKYIEKDGIVYYLDNKTVKTVALDEEIIKPESTGLKELDQEAISKYKTKLSNRANDIVTLYELGKLPQWQAESMLQELDALRTSMNKGRSKKGKIGQFSNIGKALQRVQQVSTRRSPSPSKTRRKKQGQSIEATLTKKRKQGALGLVQSVINRK